MMNRYLIDYISYTFYLEALYDPDRGDIWSILNDGLPDYINRDELAWSMTNGKAPRRLGFDSGANINNHTFIFWNLTGLVLIEHTGQGCDWLRSIGELDTLLTTPKLNYTRIDIAHDIETDARPLDFTEKRTAKQQRAYGIQKSDSGETVYIGSKKSDRVCKVYRYEPPHPRAHLLRIEYTYRGEQARVISGLFVEGKTVEDVAIMSGVRYQWTHEDYKTDRDTDGITAWRPDRKSGKTVRWLLSQAAPSLARQMSEGAITLEEFLNAVRIELNRIQGKPDDHIE